MNGNIFEGNWKEMSGPLKEWWGKFSDEDLKQAGGKTDKIVALLQKRYGYTQEQAEQEFNQRVKDLKRGVKIKGCRSSCGAL